MFALARIDYSRFRELRVGIYSAMIFTIVLVLVLGVAALGARRWIELPFFQFQPSELGKLLLVLALAGFAIDRARRQTAWQRTARLLLLGFVPALIVFVQPDLGTALVYGVITLAILFVSGTPWQHFAALGGIALAAVAVVLLIAPAVGHPVLHGYQLDRLTSFLNPSDDPADSSYQTNQALIAIGSGGKTGRGDDATQVQNGFLPEAHTDFMFSAIAERWGFVGAALASIPLRAAHMASAADNDSLEELVREPRRGGNRLDAALPGFRQRRDERRADARHGRPASAGELRRHLGARHLHGDRRSSEHLRPIAAFLAGQAQNCSVR